MSTLMGLFTMAMFCSTVVLVALIIGLSMPKSPLKDLLVQVAGWGVAVFSAVYVISPIDVIPEAFLGPIGALDDIAAAITGIGSAMAARRAGRSARPSPEAPSARVERPASVTKKGLA